MRHADIATRVVSDPAELDPYLDAWDELASAAARPCCAPGWMLAWWRHVPNGNSRLRVILVLEQGEDGERLIGVGPFFARMRRFGIAELRLLTAGFSHRIGPLAARGREREVGAALADALATMSPRPASVVLEGVDAGEPWAEILAEAWPARRAPRIRNDLTMDSLVVDLGDSYEEWLASKSKNFREQARRRARRLADEGIEPRTVGGDAGAADLMRLHYDRWDDRGGSTVPEAAAAVYAEAAGSLPRERLEITLLERDGQGAVAAQLMVSAGGVAAYGGGGFDASLARYAPGTQALLAAFESAADRGIAEIDLGGGDQHYKRRLADCNLPLAWRTVYPRGWRYPVLRAMLAPKHAKQSLRRVFRRLPEERQEAIKRLVGRVGALVPVLVTTTDHLPVAALGA